MFKYITVCVTLHSLIDGALTGASYATVILNGKLIKASTTDSCTSSSRNFALSRTATRSKRDGGRKGGREG